MSDFTSLVDLASERVGGVVLAANDDFFAPKENLLKIGKPMFVEDKYTDRGKWMDGWETRRRRETGYDWCLLRLGLPGAPHGFVVDTSFFKGNYPESCSIEGCEATADVAVDDLLAPTRQWTELLPRCPLNGDWQNMFPIAEHRRCTHLRFNIFPDGGVARLRVYGRVYPNWDEIARSSELPDLAAVEHGGLVIACSDMFFGSRHNLIMPGHAINMSDGWETKRRRGPGHDWSILQLGAPGTIERIEVDTAHFKGNAPASCSIDACMAADATAEQLVSGEIAWNRLLEQLPLRPDTLHVFHTEVQPIDPVTHARLNIFPDGGVSRLRLYGRLRRVP